jgi:hypothetical protein
MPSHASVAGKCQHPCLTLILPPPSKPAVNGITNRRFARGASEETLSPLGFFRVRGGAPAPCPTRGSRTAQAPQAAPPRAPRAPSGPGSARGGSPSSWSQTRLGRKTLASWCSRTAVDRFVLSGSWYRATVVPWRSPVMTATASAACPSLSTGCRPTPRVARWRWLLTREIPGIRAQRPLSSRRCRAVAACSVWCWSGTAGCSPRGRSRP